MKQITRKLIIIVKSVRFMEQHWNVGVGLPISMHGCYFWRDPESKYSNKVNGFVSLSRPILGSSPKFDSCRYHAYCPIVWPMLLWTISLKT